MEKTRLIKIASFACAIFSCLGMLFIPFSWKTIPFQQKITSFLVGDLVAFVARKWNLQLILTDFSSDSKGLYLLVGLFVLISLFLSTFFMKIIEKEIKVDRITLFIRKMIAYYLAIILLKYGFDKLFKTQFILPEPNILFTPLGKMDKDILFWSTMGSSYTYNILTGMAEIIPAIFLLFKRTRGVGLLISLGVLLNICIINLSFDISVKLFSGFLLFITFFALTPFLKKYYSLSTKETYTEYAAPVSDTQNTQHVLVKCAILLFFGIESLLPYIQANNFNDDTFARPALHGVYQIYSVVQNGQHIPNHLFQYRRFFIHRDNYLIFQNQQDEMVDLAFDLNLKNNTIITHDYTMHDETVGFSFDRSTKKLTLFFKRNHGILTITGKAENWKQLPLLRNQFHLTVD
jgi:hypothetical protein